MIVIICNNYFKMRKLLIMLCLILAVACTREQVPGDGGWLTVDLGGLATTKSIIGATAAEMQVNSLNLYVFDSNGMLEE